MHEMSLVRLVVDAVLNECAGTNITKVKTVSLTVGEMRDVVVDYVSDLFRYLAKGTVAAEAEVVIDTIPACVTCPDCGESFAVNVWNPKGWECPNCHATSGFKIQSGMEFGIDSIEVEEADEGSVPAALAENRLSA